MNVQHSLSFSLNLVSVGTKWVFAVDPATLNFWSAGKELGLTLRFSLAFDCLFNPINLII